MKIRVGVQILILVPATLMFAMSCGDSKKKAKEQTALPVITADKPVVTQTSEDAEKTSEDALVPPTAAASETVAAQATPTPVANPSPEPTPTPSPTPTPVVVATPAPLEDLVISGAKLDYNANELQINILVADKFMAFAWPNKGAIIKVPGICKPDSSALKITVSRKNNIYTTDQTRFFTGKSVLANDVLMGFDHNPTLFRFRKNRAVASFKCPKGNVTISGLRLDPKFQP